MSSAKRQRVTIAATAIGLPHRQPFELGKRAEQTNAPGRDGLVVEFAQQMDRSVLVLVHLLAVVDPLLAHENDPAHDKRLDQVVQRTGNAEFQLILHVFRGARTRMGNQLPILHD